MLFFNRYKDLFDVDTNCRIPQQRLRIDNQLFIDKPYLNSYTQEYSLSNKLKDLKKEYDNFQNEVSAIAAGGRDIIPKGNRESELQKRSDENASSASYHMRSSGYSVQEQQTREDRFKDLRTRQVHQSAKELQQSMKQSLPSLKLTYQSSKPSQLSLLLNSELPLLDRVANESANKRIGTVDSTTLVKRESFQIKKKNREGMESRQIARQKEQGDANSRRKSAILNLQNRRQRLRQLLQSGWQPR